MRRLASRRVVLPASALVALVLACCVMLGDEPAATPQGAILARFTQDGTEYAIHADGGAYRRRGDEWVLAARLFEPGAQDRAYVERDGVTHVRDDGGNLIPMRREFRADFEAAPSLRELIGLEPGWTAFTLQSPTAPTVSDYVALRREILAGRAGFRDNALELADVAHGGRRAMRARSVAKSSAMVCCKTSIETELLHAVSGDVFHFDGWFFLEAGTPFTLVDVETTWILQHPGIRVVVWGGRHLGMELKWADKPQYRQVAGREVDIPRGRWFRLRFALDLSAGEDGRVRVWQDEVLVVDAPGRTLPVPFAVYNSLEVGITSNHDAATLLMDDLAVAISRR